jgi:MFS family permease
MADTIRGTGRGMPPAATAPARAGLVLTSLIAVAAVANLNLSVANVALPSIGRAFDSSQTTLDLIAVGYSLGLAASVLYLGALGGRHGRKLLLVLGMVLSVPACLLAAYAPDDSVLLVARILGGLSAGMAYPTTLALIAALWSGPGRTTSIALWSAIGGGIAALGPLVAGGLLEQFWWGSVFLITLPLAVIALVMAWMFVPAHVNETTEPVDNLGGVLSVVLVGTLILAINFAPVPNKGTLVLSLALIALAALIAFVIRQRRARNPLYDLHIAGRRIFWGGGVRRDYRVRLPDGLGVRQSAVPAETVGLLHPGRGGRLLACRSVHDPGRAPVSEARRGPWRSVHIAGRVCVSLARLSVDAPAVEEGQPLLADRCRICVHRHRGRLRRYAGVTFPDRFGTRTAGWNGVGYRGPAARSGRRDHAIDLRGAADGRVCERVLGGNRGVAEQAAGNQHRSKPADQVVLQR